MKAKKISLVGAGLVLLALCIVSFSFAVTITHEYDELNRLIRTTVEDTTAQVPVISEIWGATKPAMIEGATRGRLLKRAVE